MLISVTKFEAARRQLNVAIRLMFEGIDPIAIHTLIGAASVLLGDLAGHHHPSGRWETLAQQANNLTEKTYFRIARYAQNFLKHADSDVDSILEFDPIDTDALAFGAVMNVQLFDLLTVEESVLQLWYFACHYPSGDGPDELFSKAVGIFGDLRNCNRDTRLRRAQDVMTRELRERSSQ
jgi:hypothetical protein